MSDEPITLKAREHLRLQEPVVPSRLLYSGQQVVDAFRAGAEAASTRALSRHTGREAIARAVFEHCFAGSLGMDLMLAKQGAPVRYAQAFKAADAIRSLQSASPITGEPEHRLSSERSTSALAADHAPGSAASDGSGTIREQALEEALRTVLEHHREIEAELRNLKSPGGVE